jgi:hypothetical protein
MCEFDLFDVTILEIPVLFLQCRVLVKHYQTVTDNHKKLQILQGFVNLSCRLF